ncbi:phospholipase D-like domain-containing protein [Streptomyces sp. NPDC051320]|uniref:phospholipase D-like domain-containing protein n=1 Tax=Streptomyces sp. NPDC051320 TaxID=3154644 RepID=UPI0034167507
MSCTARTSPSASGRCRHRASPSTPSATTPTNCASASPVVRRTPLREHVRIWQRADRSARSGLHAKVIAADRRTALLGSANLTGRARSDNVEIGVILRDSKAVGRLVDRLHWLTTPEAGFLRPG